MTTLPGQSDEIMERPEGLDDSANLHQVRATLQQIAGDACE